MSQNSKSILVAFIFLALSLNEAMAQFSTPFNANTSFTPSYGPSMAVSEDTGQTIYHLAFYKRFGVLSDMQVYYTKSNLGGVNGSWADPIPLSANIPALTQDDTAVDVVLAAKGETIIVIWQQQGKIYLARSINGGRTFEAAFEVSDSAVNPSFRRLPDCVIDSNSRIHLVWSEDSTIKYSSSATGAQGSWSIVEEAMATSTFRPKLIVDNSNDKIVLAAHQISDNHRLQIRSKTRNSSDNWDIEPITSILLSGSSDAYLNLAIDNTDTRIYIIYTDNSSDNPNLPGENPILVRSTLDQGSSWTTAVEIGQGYLPDIVVKQDPGSSGEELHALWYEPIAGTPSTTGNIRFRKGGVPGNVIGLWDVTEARNTGPAEQVHFNTMWSAIDFLLDTPQIITNRGRSTVMWTDNSTEQVTLSQEIVSCDVASFSMNVDQSPYANGTFPIEITATNSFGQPIIDQNCDAGEITIVSNLGNFSPTSIPINVISSPFTFFGSVDSFGSATLTATLNSNPSATGTSNSFIIQNTELANDDLNFIRSQRDPTTGMVVTVFNQASPDNTSHIYTNALSIIAFVHKGILDSDPDFSFVTHATQILTTLADNNLQISGGVNNGGFFDAYDATTLAAVSTNVTSGNNAWLLMAINYYTIYTNDSQFLNMAIDLGKFLLERQVIVADPDPDVNPIAIGGIYSRDTEKATYVTEHQAEVFSGLFYLSQIDGVVAADALSFGNSADEVKRFMIGPRNVGESDSLFNGSRFEVALNRTTNTSLDAQTASFLAFSGPFVKVGMNTDDISSSLSFVFSNIFKQQNYLNLGRLIDGPAFREADPDANCHGLTNIDSTIIDASQKVWIEGDGQLALSLNVWIDAIDKLQAEVDAGTATTEEIDLLNNAKATLTDALVKRNNLLENIQKVRDPSGSYPTHLGEQFECADLDGDMVEDEALSVGNEEISVAPAAWSYFNKVESTLNPYTPDPVLIVDQDKVFIPADGASTVNYRVTLRQARSVDNRNIEFVFETGNGSLDGNAAPATFTRSTSTGTDGVVTLNYTAGPIQDISKVVINLRESESQNN